MSCGAGQKTSERTRPPSLTGSRTIKLSAGMFCFWGFCLQAWFFPDWKDTGVMHQQTYFEMRDCTV